MRIARRLIFATLITLIWAAFPARAQQIAIPDSISRAMATVMPIYDSLLGGSVEKELNVLPRVDYNDTPKPYIVGKVRVHGAVAVDPQSRNAILEGIRQMNRAGSTVVYTRRPAVKI